MVRVPHRWDPPGPGTPPDGRWDYPSGTTHIRYGWVLAGDTVGPVVRTHPRRTADVPFRQAVVLRAQPLG